MLWKFAGCLLNIFDKDIEWLSADIIFSSDFDIVLLAQVVDEFLWLTMFILENQLYHRIVEEMQS